MPTKIDPELLALLSRCRHTAAANEARVAELSSRPSNPQRKLEIDRARDAAEKWGRWADALETAITRLVEQNAH